MPTLASSGDLIQLMDPDGKYFIFRLVPGQRLETHRGIFQHDALIGQAYGAEVRSHLDKSFYLFTPSTADIIQQLKRSSQILFPKDIGLILLRLNIRPGMTVLETGTGSGGMTLALAQAVGPMGRVISYDVRPDMQNLARRNLEQVGLLDRVTLKLRDIKEGFDETDVESFFLDVGNPYDYTAQVYRALRGGGHFGCLVPTANQVSDLIISLQREMFAFIEVVEVLMREYKPVAARLRPMDRMIAHTGYLVFARPVTRSAQPAADAETPPDNEAGVEQEQNPEDLE
ncbi:MAG: tRNA (adenine-N1)-methyltransferase [Chloroflexi bacterium]|nr:tRNA (adenine-N1)-methyltransferase [Chloroflexota bacterium]